MTKLLAIRERSVVTSSVTASEKYSCSGSLERFRKGRTTTDRRGAGFIFAEAGVLCGLACAWTEAGGEPGPVHAHQAAIRIPTRATRLAARTAGRETARRTHPGC